MSAEIRDCFATILRFVEAAAELTWSAGAAANFQLAVGKLAVADVAACAAEVAGESADHLAATAALELANLLAVAYRHQRCTFVG